MLRCFSEFEVNFLDLTYTKNKPRDKKLIQYILEKLIGQNINGLPIDYDSASIEHLLPQSIGDETVVGSIGNLILVDKITNSEELKDFNFIKKIDILREKKYPLDDLLLNANQWTENEIQERSKWMAKRAYYEIWAL